jgi:hypothetical protein
MPRGGKRLGAGRKPGSQTRKTREIAQALLDKANITPLEYMMGVVQDPQAAQNRRDTFAIAAAPFVHPKLGAIASLDASGKLSGVTAVNMISVPHEMFLSREMADKDYRFRNGIAGSIVPPYGRPQALILISTPSPLKPSQALRATPMARLPSRLRRRL